MMPQMIKLNQRQENIAIICVDYLTVRHCLRGLDLAAQKYGLEHDFKTPIRGINVGNVRFTILSSRSIQNHLRGINWDLVYLDAGIDKDIRDRIVIESCAATQDFAYLDFSLYNIELVMDNLVKYQCTNPKGTTLSGPVEIESEYRRITLED